VGPFGAIAIGIIAGLVCLWAVSWLKTRLGYDDSLDVFGVHGIGGALGAMLTGIFADPALGGQSWYDYVTDAAGEFDMAAQLVAQGWGVVMTVIWCGIVSFIAFKVVDML